MPVHASPMGRPEAESIANTFKASSCDDDDDDDDDNDDDGNEDADSDEDDEEDVQRRHMACGKTSDLRTSITSPRCKVGSMD